jgi:hypothetical protein
MSAIGAMRRIIGLVSSGACGTEYGLRDRRRSHGPNCHGSPVRPDEGGWLVSAADTGIPGKILIGAEGDGGWMSP